MTRALLDTNVVLDYMLARESFAKAAEEVIIAHRAGKFQAVISAITPVNVFYITRKLGLAQARFIVERTLNEFPMLTVDMAILQTAFHLPLPDYEDAVQVTSALAENVDFIITRDVKDFVNSPIKAISPVEFMKQLG
jgi:predicted nucleic acid-binding protein